ncbi:hypothetical protein BDV34DRAFT_201848 [Aspergillus parasiticus]|uniref:Uncharacterized protein n=1 Tax=Aspergillus parasiticus TaxID=5067 RepID=A0A5N6D9G1_ASPPA|nr:hypothetical protein BDV34DRAFT_201848 [Aspergillus parasiticus]
MTLPIGSITSPFLHMLESLHAIARTGAKHLTDDLEFQGVDWYLSDGALSLDMESYNTVEKSNNDIQRAV